MYMTMIYDYDKNEAVFQLKLKYLCRDFEGCPISSRVMANIDARQQDSAQTLEHECQLFSGKMAIGLHPLFSSQYKNMDTMNT
jgi:hypothetical protein